MGGCGMSPRRDSCGGQGFPSTLITVGEGDLAQQLLFGRMLGPQSNRESAKERRLTFKQSRRSVAVYIATVPPKLINRLQKLLVRRILPISIFRGF